VKHNPDNSPNLRINRPLQLVISVVGAIILMVFWKSWRDTVHLVYDIPTGLVISAYIGQIICEGINRWFTPNWWIRVILLVPMTIIPAGRWFLDWPISGHLSIMLAVAVIQTIDNRLKAIERVIYWIPVPIILYIRWFYFDKNGHGDTYNALLTAAVIILIYIFASRLRK
jgi:hypothetical protein